MTVVADQLYVQKPDGTWRFLPWFGLVGQAELQAKQERLLNRHRRRGLTSDERRELESVDEAVKELDALLRAHLRAEVEGIADPLAIVRIQADELVAAGLTLRSLLPEDLLACHERWPDWLPGPVT